MVEKALKVRETRISRSVFLGVLLGMHLLYAPAVFAEKSQSPFVDPAILVTEEPQFGPPLAEVFLSPAERYAMQHEREKEKVKQIIVAYPVWERKNILDDVKSLSTGQLLEDIDIYFPLYKAAEEKFGIPWYYLWTIHAPETTASRNPNPEANGFIGAMQIAPMHYQRLEIQNAPLGYEFLKDLPQRYSKERGFRTNDWEEIMRGAAFLKLKAGEIYPHLPLKIGIDLVVQNNYSRWDLGAARFKKIKELSQLFS